MDSSLSKALIMAAGVLLAMVVVGFMMYSFRKLSSWSTTQGEELTAVQLEKFNKEYEAYDKDLMYGVDVISCLNKAKSNNDKVDDGTYDKSYLVTVTVKFKKQLKESMIVYYLNQNNKEEKVFNQTDFKATDAIGEVFPDYKLLGKMASIRVDDSLKPFSDNIDMSTDVEYKLNANNDTNDVLKAFLGLRGELKQVATNKKPTRSNNWTKVEWETPLYDMKTRKFKCSNIKYSQSGRIDLIEFEEF